jgi:hypothetical protein
MPKGEVGDEFLSFLVAVIDSEREIAMDSAALHHELPVFNKNPSSLFDLLKEVDRRKAGDQVQLGFSFESDLHVPVPFSIFRHHPIWIDTSGTILLRESRAQSLTLGPLGGRQTVIAPAYEYILDSGHASIRVDGWLTVLTLGLLADFSFQAVCLFKTGGAWYGLIAGTGPRNRPISWLFSLTAMRVVYPMPDELRSFASGLVSSTY